VEIIPEMAQDDFAQAAPVIEQLVADGDQAIPPEAERLFATRMGATTVAVPTNHVAMASHPDDVVTLIETAAEAVPVAR
jgi:hypothetical protein